MEADHRQTAARLEPRHRRVQPGFKIGQFAIDVDADGLEAARGRMDLVLATRHHRCNQLRQFGGTRERLGGAAGHDGARDAAALALIAVRPQHVGDFAVFRAVEPLRCTLARVRVHAHVQRAVLAEAETTLGHVQLRRRHAQVEQHAIQTGSGFVPVQQVGKAPAMDRHAAIRREVALGHGDGFGILVHDQQTAIGTELTQHATGMTATAERAIQIGTIFDHPQARKDLGVQHRQVARRRL
ncbi:hypothetical protein D3C81_1143350 [compost metagenome]